MKSNALVLALVALLLVATSVWAMSSPAHRLDWLTPGTSGGGGTAHSTHYAVNLTVGQTAVVKSGSTNFGAGLGYWFGVLAPGPVYLPMIVK